ncbi:MAG: mechanosensitive ion channel family protein, partial [Povalibacter sp.]
MPENLPLWDNNWMHVLATPLRLLVIIVVAWLLRRVLRALIEHLRGRFTLPPELVVGMRRSASFIITTVATLLILKELGMSAAFLWTIWTGFVAVAAVACFA